MKELTYSLYNLGPLSERVTNPRCRLELRAQANLHNHDPERKRFKAMAQTECVGRRMPILEPYKRYRSRKTEARANVCLYLLDHLDSGPAEWWDGDVWWWKPRHPSQKHVPRSTLWVPVEGDWLIGVGHAPEAPSRRWPERANKTLAEARKEWVDVHVERMRAHQGPVVLLADTNGLARELRRRVPKLVVAGFGVDTAHTSGIVEQSVHHTEMNGVEAWSDHKGFVSGAIQRRGA